MTDANHLAARQAALTLHRGAADPATIDAARDLAAAKLEAAIRGHRRIRPGADAGAADPAAGAAGRAGR